jgi:hypothetical protein
MPPAAPTKSERITITPKPCANVASPRPASVPSANVSSETMSGMEMRS